MSRCTFIHAKLILPDTILDDASLVVEDGRIAAIHRKTRSKLQGEVIDIGGAYLSPGFIDIHVHGGAGADFMDGTVDAFVLACEAHRRHGTTTLFPTTTTGAPSQIEAMIAACQQARKQLIDRVHIEGIHLYGPYFAEDKVGCHSPHGRRSPEAKEYQKYFRTGLIRIATCAAELDQATAFYRYATKRKCLVTCGHSNSSWNEMQRAFDCGMRHVDHFWCAMSSIPSLRQRFGVPMQASMAEFVLANREMSTEVIADGQHLSSELLEFAYRMIGPHRLLLVTDSNRGLDLPPGRYRFGSLDDGTWFDSDGKVGWATDGSLASSVQGMDHMVRIMKRSTSASLPEVIRMASLTPAERTGIADRTGSIEVGKQADMVVLSNRLHVKQVFVSGKL